MSSRAPVAQPLPEPQAEELIEPAFEAAPLPAAENVVPLVQPVSTPVAVDAAELATLAARVTQLEAHMADQDATMRRVLAMLIDWMEKENQSLAQRMREARAA